MEQDIKDINNTHEYEFDALSNGTIDRDIHMVHTYEDHLDMGDMYSVRHDESNSTNINFPSSKILRDQRN